MIHVFKILSLGIPQAGLVPVFDTYIKVSDGTSAGTPPAITELGGGSYKFTATPSEAIYFVIDGTDTLEGPDRYIADQISPEDDIANIVWDEQLSLHTTQGSAGRRLRNITAVVITEGTSPSAPLQVNQIILNGNASAVDGAYDPAHVSIVEGTGAGQTRLIYQYAGSTKTATVDRDWKVQPDDTSEYIITADAGREHVNEGLAQAGGASTITLNALASSLDDAYDGQIIFIRSGVGADQARKVISYDGTTKIATLDSAWGTQPDNTSAYVMLPTGSFIGNVADIHDSIFGTATLDYDNETLTLLRPGGGALAIFDMSESSDTAKSFTVRTPQ